MNDILRDSPFGQIVRLLSNNKYFQYAEEPDGFQHPYYNSDVFLKEVEAGVPITAATSNTALGAAPIPDSVGQVSQDSTMESSVTEADEDVENGQFDNPIERVVTMQSYREVQKTESRPIKPTTTSDGTILVDWYTTGNIPLS
ncbi:hypothetical protein ACHAQJ_009178 [Trichoderma viride]